MRLFNYFICSLVTVSMLLLSSCSDDGEGGASNDRTIPNEPITASVIGIVYDLQNNPVEDVLVSVGAVSAITDKNGVYSFRDVIMNKAGTLISARKDGYFKNVKLSNPSETAISTVNFQLLEKIEIGTFSAAQGGQFATNGNGRVSVPPNAIMSSAGTAYTGQVIMSAYWLDPSSINIGDQMPGDLRGFALDNETVQLATYGMMAVELESPAGEELNLLPGSSATLTFPVPTILQSDAPSEIPTWSMNEATGYWEEEGVAEKIGGNYVAEVTHFSFWNCDAPFPLIEWSQQILGANGSPLQGVNVKVRLGTSATARCATTNQLGIVSGKIPKDELLTLQVFEPSCQTSIHTGSIGPFNTDTSSPPISIGQTSVRQVNLNGSIVDCNGLPVTNGLVKIQNSSLVFPIAANGTITASFINCTNEVSLVLIDLEEFKQSQVLTFNTPNPINSINLGVESVCFDLDEFISMTFDGQTFLWIDHFYTSNISSGVNTVSWFSPNTDTHSGEISWTGAGLGSFPFAIWANIDPDFDQDWVTINCDTPPCNETIEITLSEPVNGYIEGNITANLTSSISGNQVPVTGSFRVKND